MKLPLRSINCAIAWIVVFSAFHASFAAPLSNPAPIVVSISPTLGPVGQWIYVHGTNFIKDQTTVSICGIDGIKATVYSTTQLGFTLPGGSEGNSLISISTPSGQASSSQMFTVGVPSGEPTATTISPTLGPLGQWVYVSGTEFVRENTTISFSGISNITAYVYGPNSLGFRMPEGVSGTGPITVVTPNGSATTTAFFTVGIPDGPPTFSRLREYVGHNWVYLTGENFVYGNTTVYWSHQHQVQAHVYGPTSLGFSPPENFQAAGMLGVRTPNGEFQRPMKQMINIELEGKKSERYQIQYSNDLKTWIPVGPVIDGEDTALRMMAAFGNRPSEFYRVAKEKK